MGNINLKFLHPGQLLKFKP